MFLVCQKYNFSITDVMAITSKQIYLGLKIFIMHIGHLTMYNTILIYLNITLN